MTLPSVTLKPGKEKPILNKHHWIFSGAIQSLPKFEDGDFLNVVSSKGEFLGSGYFSNKSGITGRVIAFDQTPPLECIEECLKNAWKWRQNWFDTKSTNAFRWINGEGDGIPGLVIDVYSKVFVLQSATKGIDKIKRWLVDTIQKQFQPVAIFEKSNLPVRKEEGLAPFQGLLYGKIEDSIAFLENGLTFTTNLEQSQKTGFFLDHREMRQWIRTLSKDKRVLNAFCYTGGFSVYALAGGAKHVDSVDISEEAIQQAKKHVLENGFSLSNTGFYSEDVFTFLREKELGYDLVILDPPAFAKKKKDVIAACRGYKDINRIAMQKMPAGSLLLTCSCSHHVDSTLFQQVVFQAAAEARRKVRIVGTHRLALDHPINLFHPEGNYLKSLLLAID